MFGWFRKRRRQRLRSRSFPSAWEPWLTSNARFLSTVSLDNQASVRHAIQVLVHEKNWEGCGGLKLTDEHRVTIAAQVARLTLALHGDYFDEVRSILLYPDAYLAESQQDFGSGIVGRSSSGRLGEAWYRGPVILSWQDVLRTGRGLNHARNVVIHEFAHQLDMRNGRFADGIPPIESSDLAQRWLRMLAHDRARLRQLCEMGVGGVLDCYGASNDAEFFAVASEAFFEAPQDLAVQWPDLHQLLGHIYSVS